MKNNKGFSFVELMLTAAIVSTTVGATLVSFHMSSQLNESARNHTVAMTHAVYIMEDIQDTNFSDIETFANRGDWNWVAADITNEGLDVIKDETTQVQVSNSAGLLDITILVNWTDASQRGQNVVLRTYMMEAG